MKSQLLRREAELDLAEAAMCGMREEILVLKSQLYRPP